MVAGLGLRTVQRIGARNDWRSARTGIPRAVYLATVCFLAAALVALAEPSAVGLIMPLLGGASIVVLREPLGCLRRRQNAPSTR